MIWMTGYLVVLTVSGISYLFLLLMIIMGIAKLRLESKKGANHYYQDSPALQNESNLPRITVVVAARNEEKNITQTLASLSNQNYPTDLYEIIIVDDRSTDRTAEIVSEFATQNRIVKLIQQTEVVAGHSPKKQALEKGINAASGKIILTTDADCIHDPNWVKEMVACFRPGVAMISGQARFSLPQSAPLWQRLQALDFQSLGYTSAGLIAAGMPFNCSGASLAFTRSLFEKIDGWKGYEKLVSGDDELLMAKAAKRGWKIVAATSPATIVKAEPVSSLKELWNQRIRWGSKGLYYRLSRRLVLSGVFIFFLALIAGPVIGILSSAESASILWKFWLFCIIFRLVLDLIALHDGSRLFSEKYRFFEFFLADLVYPFTAVAFAVAGHFTSFEWKEQRFRSRGDR